MRSSENNTQNVLPNMLLCVLPNIKLELRNKGSPLQLAPKATHTGRGNILGPKAPNMQVYKKCILNSQTKSKKCIAGLGKSILSFSTEFLQKFQNSKKITPCDLLCEKVFDYNSPIAYTRVHKQFAIIIYFLGE